METTTDQNEDKATTAIEQQTVKLPSDIFLGAALAAMGVSLMFKLMEKDHKALFFGQWAAPFLLLGIYNKIVKSTAGK